MAKHELPAPPQGNIPQGRVGVVMARFNHKFVAELFTSFSAYFEQYAQQLVLDTLTVPGSLEIAHGMRVLAERNDDLRVLVGLGCVIKGSTFHFELVSSQSAKSIARASELTGVPAINGVLTCYDENQAKERAASNGSSFANAAIRMAQIGTVLSNSRSNG